MDADQNYLIELLPRADRQRLLAQCKSVDLKLGEVLCESGAIVRDAYFPVDGFISLLTRIEGHPSLEVGMAGREGCLGAELVLGMKTAPLQALVQGSGAAWRISAADLRRQIALSGALRSGLSRYLSVVTQQLAYSAACLRFHLMGPRLARWLLMTADRSHADHFRVTHTFLATMLGVRRVGVTVAAGALQRQGLISYHRGEVQLLDRKGLKAAACSCYETQQRLYRDQMGRDR